MQAWPDRGADTSRGTPCEPLKSASKWAEKAQGDEKLLSMRRLLRQMGHARGRGREGSSKKRPFSCSSVPKVFAVAAFECLWLACVR